MSDENLGRAVLALATDDSGLDSGLNAAQGKAQNWVADVGKILGGIAIGAAVVKGVDMLIGGLKDMVGEAMSAESATAQLDAVLRSTAAGATDTANAMPQVSDAAGQAIQDISQKHSEAIATILETATERTADVQSRLSDMAESFAYAAADRQARYNEQIAAGARQLNERLADLADQHAERQQNIQRQIGDLGISYGDSKDDRRQKLEENLQNLAEQTADKRQKLQENLAKATTDIQRTSILQQIALLDTQEQKERAKLEERARQEEERAKKQYDRQLARLQENLAREEQAYQKQQDKLRQQGAEREAQLAAQYARENALAQRSYDKQVEDNQKALDKIARDKDKALAKEAAAAAKAMADLEKKFSAVDLGKIVNYHAIQPARQAILDLADALAKVTPIEDDAILSGENMLLTFTNIGRDVFPTATQTLLDMATAMNGGVIPTAENLSNQAIQLGKALNDPIAGISALTRVGVTFTEAQKEQIKAMVDAGDVAGAQKIILQELQKEFGGSAEAAGKTFAGQLAILKNALGNVKEEVGGALIPVLSDLVTKYGPDLVQFAKDGGAWIISDLIPAFKNAVDWVGAKLPGGIATLKEKFNENWPLIKQSVLDAWTLMEPKLTLLKSWLDTDVPLAITTFKTSWDKDILPTLKNLWFSLTDPATGILPAGKLLVDWLKVEIPAAFVPSNVAFKGGADSVNGLHQSLTDFVTPVRTFLDYLKKIEESLNNVQKAVNDAGMAVHNFLFYTPAWWEQLIHLGQGNGAPGYALGTSFFPGGLATVGEAGPEVVALPRGSQIYPNGEGPGGGGHTFNFYGPVTDPAAVRGQVLDALDIARRGGQR